MTERTAGLRGRLPQRTEGNRFAIRWADEYGAPPAPTYPIDVSEGITAWEMLGNDTLGDCGPAAVGHERMIAGAHPTTAEIEKLYLTYTGGKDVGVVLADFLLWLFHGGYIEGFAPVQPATVDAIMCQFQRGVLLGVSLTDDANDLFNQGQPWGSGSVTPDPNEGHAILKVKSAGAAGDGTIVTWGADQACTGPWLSACIDEAWVLVTKDDLSTAGYAALLADLSALPHNTEVPPPPAPTPAPPKPTPTPAPTPAPPAPTPGPSPDPLDAALAAFVAKHYSAAAKNLATLLVQRVKAL